MKFLKNLGTTFLFSLVLFSCKEEKNKNYQPESIGPINSVAVVMENSLWEGPVGDKVREYFAASVPALIWDEPQFTITHLPPQVFEGMVRNTRSVLLVQLDSVNVAHIKSDVYARPQKVGVIKASSIEGLITNLDKKAAEMVSAFKVLEINETQNRFKRSLSKETVLKDKFGVALDLPSVYKVGKQEDNFVWIDRQIQKGSMNIIAYELPQDSFTNDSTFVKDIVKLRDSIGKKYIPGPDVKDKVTYMVTEKAFAPYVFPAEIAGMKGAEVRGIWEMENYPMAGPFITYILNDTQNNRKIVLEGFTFAPATEKRDYMFELEAILKTAELVDKK
ncbi:DUF4837 family protein [Costertonia aggregata]|uniref:DUF4837 family protein n=1 Tax=Costertonia aggregata TaxID=343403 RepID=A0A7H9APA4_9FLAO|nr:DUF4837 family protein [Costertonia aggregata]QLG45262.1 DUF4837 family protein [Costertonia aggregata]